MRLGIGVSAPTAALAVAATVWLPVVPDNVRLLAPSTVPFKISVSVAFPVWLMTVAAPKVTAPVNVSEQAVTVLLSMVVAAVLPKEEVPPTVRLFPLNSIDEVLLMVRLVMELPRTTSSVTV